MNAIPIVKKEFWPFKKVDIPVIQIDDWNSGSLMQMDLLQSYEFSFRDSLASSPFYWLTR